MTTMSATDSSAKKEMTNSEIARALGTILRQLDQQTASYAALAGIIATMPAVKRCRPRAAMRIAGMMVPDATGNDVLRKAAAANVMAILTAHRAIEKTVEKVRAEMSASGQPAGARPS